MREVELEEGSEVEVESGCGGSDLVDVRDAPPMLSSTWVCDADRVLDGGVGVWDEGRGGTYSLVCIGSAAVCCPTTVLIKASSNSALELEVDDDDDGASWADCIPSTTRRASFEAATYAAALGHRLK